MVMDSVVGSAPGKILWFGGYAVLERPNIGVVTTVDARVTARAKRLAGAKVRFNAPQLKSRARGKLDAATGKLSVAAPEQLKLVLTAAEIATRYAVGKGKSVFGFSLNTKNALEFGYEVSKDGVNVVQKSGLGASAAVTVATIGALLALFEVAADDREVLHKLAQLSHSLATGKVGSGFDVAAAAYGSIVYTRFSPDIVKGFPADYTNEQLVALAEREWDYRIEKFEMPKVFRLTMANFVGHAMSTKSAVSEVNKFKASDPATHRRLVDGINAESLRAMDAIKAISITRRGSKGQGKALGELKAAVESGRRLTKELGIRSGVEIEADEETKLMDETVANGAYTSKLPGAGGKDSIVSLSTSREDRDRLVGFLGSKGHLRLLDVGFENKGFMAKLRQKAAGSAPVDPAANQGPLGVGEGAGMPA